MSHSLFELVQGASAFVSRTQPRKRTVSDVFACTTSELGELGEEIAIQNGYSYKEEGADGIVGEAVDTILCLLDLIYVQTDGEITEKEVNDIARHKLAKWTSKVAEAEDRKLSLTAAVRSFKWEDPKTENKTRRPEYEAVIRVETNSRHGWDDAVTRYTYETLRSFDIDELRSRAQARVVEINQSPPHRGDFGIVLGSCTAKLLKIQRTVESLIDLQD